VSSKYDGYFDMKGIGVLYCCSLLQCVGVRCSVSSNYDGYVDIQVTSVLQCVAVCCSVLQHVVV